MLNALVTHNYSNSFAILLLALLQFTMLQVLFKLRGWQSFWLRQEQL